MSDETYQVDRRGANAHATPRSGRAVGLFTTSEPILDASAVLAFLQKEPGQETVAAVLEQGRAVICAVNLSEVAAKLVDGA